MQLNTNSALLACYAGQCRVKWLHKGCYLSVFCHIMFGKQNNVLYNVAERRSRQISCSYNVNGYY